MAQKSDKDSQSADSTKYTNSTDSAKSKDSPYKIALFSRVGQWSVAIFYHCANFYR